MSCIGKVKKPVNNFSAGRLKGQPTNSRGRRITETRREVCIIECDITSIEEHRNSLAAQSDCAFGRRGRMPTAKRGRCGQDGAARRANGVHKRGTRARLGGGQRRCPARSLTARGALPPKENSSHHEGSAGWRSHARKGAGVLVRGYGQQRSRAESTRSPAALRPYGILRYPVS